MLNEKGRLTVSAPTLDQLIHGENFMFEMPDSLRAAAVHRAAIVRARDICDREFGHDFGDWAALGDRDVRNCRRCGAQETATKL